MYFAILLSCFQIYDTKGGIMNKIILVVFTAALVVIGSQSVNDVVILNASVNSVNVVGQKARTFTDLDFD